MHSPGVEVRPLTQITGEAEFNEIFFADVEVPVENVIGEPGQGWQVAMTTLMHERAALGFALSGAFEVAVGKLLELARGRELDDRLRDLIAQTWIELQALKWTNYRALTRLMETGAPGPEASVPKLHWSEANQRLGKLALELLGPGGAGDGTATATGSGSSCAAGATRSRPGPRRSSGTSSPSACSGCRRGAEPGCTSPSHPNRRRCARRRGAGSRSGIRRSGSPSSPTPRRAGIPRRGRSSPSWAGSACRSPRTRVAPGSAFLEEAVLFEELGRALYPGPYFSTVALALPALGAEDRAARRGRRGALVGAGRRARPGPRARRPGASPPTGRVAAEGETGRDDGRDPPARPARDGGRRRGGSTVRALRAALALEAVGVAQRALDWGVEHAKERQQFGKSIGVYQAVSHSLVDAFMATELSRSLAYWAAWCVAEGDEQASAAAAAAKAYAAEAAVSACERSIQVHGGIGFTWEHPLHRYYKRAQWIQAFDGFPARQRAEVAAELLA